MAVGVLRNVWRYLFQDDTIHQCESCKAKDASVEVLRAQIEFLQEQVKNYENVIFRRGQQPELPKAPVGGFESLSRRRLRLEREARIRANGTLKEKGWKLKSIEELEAEVSKGTNS